MQDENTLYEMALLGLAQKEGVGPQVENIKARLYQLQELHGSATEEEVGAFFIAVGLFTIELGRDIPASFR